MKKTLLVSIVFSVLFFSGQALAESLDYQGAVVVDSDLDGLTDLGEEKMFGTDKMRPDSDSDGMLDGAEVMGGSDALDASSPQRQMVIKERTVQIEKEVPWAWYLTRASGLVAFFLLFLDVFFGLAIRLPFFQRVFPPRQSYSFHAFLAVQALVFVLIHSLAQLFDKYTGFGWADIFLPMAAEKYTIPIAWGIISFYIMVIMVLTSFGRRFVGNRLWRVAHHLNIVLFFAVIFHVLMLGTDMKIEAIRWTFIGMNIFLGIMIIWNMIHRARAAART